MADQRLVCDPLPEEFIPIARKWGEKNARMLCNYLAKWLEKKRESIKRYREWLESLGIPQQIIEKRIRKLEEALSGF